MEQKNEKKKIVSKALFKFALTSLYKYVTIKPKENIVFSPYNIYQGLSSIYLISSGEMEQRLKEILYLPADLSKNVLMNIINFDKCDMIKIINFKYPANRSARYEIPLVNGFESIISNNIQHTNREFNEILQSLIKNYFRIPVNLKVKTENMDIFLANIHNFKDRNQIVFQSTSGSTDAPSLTPSYLNFRTFSSRKLQVRVNELIIKEHFTSLYMLTPFSKSTNKRVETDTQSTSLFRLIERLSTSEGMDILRKLLSRARTVNSLHCATRLTFEIEKYLDMRVLLRELGIEQLLTPDAILLDNTVAENGQSVHFGNAVHRARVKVTQEDVKATAVTVISGQEPCSNDIIIDMDIKCPSLWFIYDKINADILYIGVFNEVHKSVSQGHLLLIDSVISKAIFKFALTSLHKYASIKPKEDFVFSPYNIYHALYSAYLISSGDMEQRLKEVLYLPADVSKNELMNIINFDKYPARRPARYTDSTFYMPYHYITQNTCTFLNKILRKNNKTIKGLYNGGSRCNHNIQDTNRTLNKTLQLLIKNRFRKLVNLKVKTEDMDIFLANVHIFHGNQIVSQSTSGSTDAPSLSTPSYLNFRTFSSDELQVDVKELIIRKDFTSLYMLIPSSTSTNKRDKTDTSSTSLSSLIERLSTSEGMDILQELLSRAGRDKPLSIVIPSTFEIEKYLDMRVLLRELGVEQLLTSDAVPLDNTVAEDDQFVHFGNAVHRARIKVTQENVKATAVTVISGQEPCSNDIIADMDTNYPFLWLIYDKMNADILYIGVFNEVDNPVSQIALTDTNQIPTK